jgi:hypothetical protein
MKAIKSFSVDFQLPPVSTQKKQRQAVIIRFASTGYRQLEKLSLRRIFQDCHGSKASMIHLTGRKLVHRLVRLFFLPEVVAGLGVDFAFLIGDVAGVTRSVALVVLASSRPRFLPLPDDLSFAVVSFDSGFVSGDAVDGTASLLFAIPPPSALLVLLSLTAAGCSATFCLRCLISANTFFILFNSLRNGSSAFLP